MMKFIDRTEELQFLERKYNSREAELIILYGRRRIGKTELLLRFKEDKKGIYFLGRLESRSDTIKRFNNILIEFFKDTSLIRKPLRNWDEIFEYIADRSSGERLLVILDEFPFIIDRFSEITSILQDHWDNRLRNTKIMLILCGSSIGMMEKYTLSYNSPLYGRRTGQWMVDKLKVKHLPKFFPSYSIEDLIILYSCLDTIPGYLVKFSPEQPIWQNIDEKLLSKGEFLYEEIEILLREEFRDPANYMSIISAIASGANRFNEIYTITGLDKSLLSKYLYILEKLGIVDRIYPIITTYKNKLKSKRGLYKLRDNFFEFWFRFVYLNKQELEEGKNSFILNRIKKEINSYLGFKFEEFIKEIILEIIPDHYSRIGKWWYKNKEIDLVGINEEYKKILFVECKWQDDVNAEKIAEELLEKSRYIEWYNNQREEEIAIFAKTFKKRINEYNNRKVYCFNLKDIERYLITC